MLLKHILLALTLAASAVAKPLPAADAAAAPAPGDQNGSGDTFGGGGASGTWLTSVASNRRGGIGMNGQKKRVLSLDELFYLGKWDDAPGCEGNGKRSSGEGPLQSFEAFGALFTKDVQGVLISSSRSGSEEIRIGAGHVWNLRNVSAPAAQCAATQAIAFTGIRLAEVEGVMFPRPLRGLYGFFFRRLPQDVVNIQRQWLQANKVTIYASFMDMSRDTEGYDRELYTGDVQ